VPARTGALRSGLSKKLLRGSMRLQVGIIGKPSNRRLFYGRIVEFGRKAQTVTVRRLRKGGRKAWLSAIGAGTASARSKPDSLTSTYRMKVRGMRARPFVYTRRTALRENINKRLAAFWKGALARASQGATDD
jgi:hypothetical protein